MSVPSIGDDGYVYVADCGDDFFHRYVLISKLIKLYTLNMHSFLYNNNTSIKWFLKNTRDTTANKIVEEM